MGCLIFISLCNFGLKEMGSCRLSALIYLTIYLFFQAKFTNQPGLAAYNEICKPGLIVDEWNHVWDDDVKGPYSYSGDKWVSYDNWKSIQLKARVAVATYKLAGMMVWSIDTDDFNNDCGDGNYPLLRSLNKGLEFGMTKEEDTPAPVAERLTAGEEEEQQPTTSCAMTYSPLLAVIMSLLFYIGYSHKLKRD